MKLSGVQSRCTVNGLARHWKNGVMPNHKQKVLHIECPYCDGDNVIARAHSGHSELDPTDREIACKYCQSLFTVSESKLWIRRLSKQDLDAA